jgi:hypothetical protein
VERDGEVGVGVANDSQRNEGACREARLLAELPARRRLERLPRLDPAAREFPETSEEPVQRPSANQPPIPGREGHDRGDDVGALGSCNAHREGPRVGELDSGPALRGDRTPRAQRPSREADRLAELHEGLVELARGVRREFPLECRLKPGPDDRTTDVAVFERPSGGDPESIRLEGDHRLAEREARDGGADVRPEPRELGEVARGPGEVAPSFADDLPRRRVEMARPRVVPGPLPRLQNVGWGGTGERVDGGEPSKERLVPGHDRGDPRLLKEDLGDPDPVRVSVGPPRERPAVFGEPVEEPLRPSERRPPSSEFRRVHDVPDETKG